jgi:hypothetical protein
MIKAIKFILGLLFFISYSQIYSQQFNIDEPWEEEDLISLQKNADTVNTSFNGVIAYPLLELIDIYQKDISPKSIHRCLFDVSCSNFAKIAIKKFGWFGLFLFIDRYLYRENIESFNHYIKIIKKNGIIELDDKEFLYE